MLPTGQGIPFPRPPAFWTLCPKLGEQKAETRRGTTLTQAGSHPYPAWLHKVPRPSGTRGWQDVNMFHKINDEGKTIIMITHDANIAAHAKRIVRILDGNIGEGDTADA